MSLQRVETAQDIRGAFGIPEPEGDAPAGTAGRPTVTTAAPQDRVEEDGAAPGASPRPGLHLDLSRSYEAKGVTFNRVDLQPPRAVDYWTLGDPFDWLPGQEGQPVYVEYIAVIRAYAAVCVKPDPRLSAGDMIDALDVRDSRALRGAVLRFFTAPAGNSG